MLEHEEARDRFVLRLKEHELNECSSRFRSVFEPFVHHYKFDCRKKAVCLQEQFFYFVSVCVPHWLGANAFKRCFKPSGVLLKLCRLTLGCTKKNLSVWLFYSRIY